METKTLEEIAGIGKIYEDIIKTGKVLLGKRIIEVDSKGIESAKYEGIFAKVVEDTLYLAAKELCLCCGHGLDYIIPQLETLPEYHGKRTIVLVPSIGGKEREIFAERPEEVKYCSELARMVLAKDETAVKTASYHLYGGAEMALVGFIPVLKEELEAKTLDLLHMTGFAYDSMVSKDTVEVLVRL